MKKWISINILKKDKILLIQFQEIIMNYNSIIIDNSIIDILSNILYILNYFLIKSIINKNISI